MEKFGFGQPVPRTEDPRLLTGRGLYVDDVRMPAMTHAVFVRSPHAHARVRALRTERAATAPGVLLVLTAADVEAEGLGHIPVQVAPRPKPGTTSILPTRPLLAGDRVRHVGDALACIVAETAEAARDAAEWVEVDYAPLPAVTDTATATDPGRPLVWDEAPRNIAFEHVAGDVAKVDAAFARAAHVTRVRIVNNRVSANPMETRGAIGVWDAAEDRYLLHAPLQGPHRTRQQLAQDILKIAENRIRIICRDFGGSFGMKGGNMYAEYPLLLLASRRIGGRPVKWIADRSESLMSDAHARDNVSTAELALDADGRFLALRVATLASVGAYVANLGAFVPVTGLGMLAGVYTTPAITVAVTGVLTNNNSTCPYRGAGRPEAIYVIERVVDQAARELGLDPSELRRRNCIPPEAMPFKTGLIFTYDSGEFAANMARAKTIADWDGFPARRTEARERGRLRGIGIANYIERCAGQTDDRAQIRFDPSGHITLIVGSMSNGQGHETVFPQMVAAAFGVPMNAIRFVQGDTDIVSFGRGTGGSRSMTLIGNAIANAVAKMVAKAGRIAAHRLEAAPEDIVYDAGRFTVAGTDRAIAITEIARAAYRPDLLPGDMEPGLDEAGTFVTGPPSFPNGCHIVEVEIDPETGRIEIVRYAAVDDVGRVVNPLLLHGQVHGGIAQGVGQALMETVAYDPASGQLLSGSFMDYAMPRADDFCPITIETNEVPCRTNPLGLKGAGEAGTVGALPAVVHAVIDALAPLGITAIDMPVTAETVWRAIAAAERAA
ncbi:MAG: xanthine dehydrogenase family protein molybdopterin-binding subunit [Alphaproteobacteria bacterium]|nr:xanthine dehydrogenase family protein molybdopterin-binding subunit [Alphaproteobacteria bacterium]